MTETTELAQITRVTRHFEQMQGLRILPAGIFLIISWINDRSQTQGRDLTIILPLFVAIIIAVVAADRYYKDRFGQVRQRKTAVTLTLLLLVVATTLLADWGDAVLQWPVSLSGLAVAGLSFIIWATTSRFRHQYLALAGVITAVSLSPLLFGNWLTPGLFGGDGILMLALVFIIGGGIDHLILVRALPQLPEEAA
jgi:hypothetical protein